MPSLTQRLDRMERRVVSGGCRVCHNGSMVIVRGSEPLPPPCPRCGAVSPVIYIPHAIPPEDWVKLAGLPHGLD